MGIQLQKAQKPMASLSKAVPLASAIPVAHLSPSCTQVWQVTDTQAKHVAAKLYIVRKEFSLVSSPSGRKQEDTDPGESIRAARWVAPGSLRLCVCGGRPAAVGPCVSRKNRQQESPLRAAGRLACYSTTWLTATPYKDSVSEGVTYFDFSKQPRMAAAPPPFIPWKTKAYGREVTHSLKATRGRDWHLTPTPTIQVTCSQQEVWMRESSLRLEGLRLSLPLGAEEGTGSQPWATNVSYF